MRFRKEEDVNGSNVVLYSMYAGNNPVIEEKYEGSTLVETRFNIISGGAVLAHVRKVYGTSEEYEYFYTDNLGSRRVVLDATGNVLDRFSYSAYGKVAHVTGSNSYLASFTGKGYDATGLIYFNARYYDPATGRFITEDPSRDGVNWYGYCDNNPVNFVDPTGMREGRTDGNEDDTDSNETEDDQPKEDRSFFDKVKDTIKDFFKSWSDYDKKIKEEKIDNLLKSLGIEVNLENINLTNKQIGTGIMIAGGVGLFAGGNIPAAFVMAGGAQLYCTPDTNSTPDWEIVGGTITELATPPIFDKNAYPFKTDTFGITLSEEGNLPQKNSQSRRNK